MPWTEDGKWEVAIRSRPIVIGSDHPKAPDAPPGTCRWCGEAIELTADAHHASRQRRYHRGDRSEVGDTDCLDKYLAHSRHDPRSALLAANPDTDLFCADCGVLCVRADRMNGEGCAPWDADHEVPLWKDGEHTLANLRMRCVPCHKDKTKREAAERAAIRRGDMPVDQLALGGTDGR